MQSDMEAIRNQMGVVDFLIFVVMLLLSSAIGIFFACRDRKNQSTDQYYLAGGRVSPFPVAISTAMSFISAITVIGFPVEVYLFGVVLIWIVVAHSIAAAVSAVYFIPLIHRLKLKSIYKYLELRFHRRVRNVICTMGMLQQISYSGIAIYLPSLALSAVTPIEIPWAIAITSIVCTFYTTIGGMKAVIWTDVLQSAFMVGGMFAVFIRAVVVVGGFQEMFSAAYRGGRMNILKFDIDPRVHSAVWSAVIGYAVSETYTRCCDQVSAQRYLACNTAKDAKIALFLALIPTCCVILLSVGCGLALYAYYEVCDPLMANQLSKYDQLMPRMATQIFQDSPGMAGLFVSAAYCGTLSTISSGTNALAALSLMDFVLPNFPNLSSNAMTTVNKMLSACYGIVVMLVAYVISASSSNIVPIYMSVIGSFVGPIVGLYLMGIFMPWISHKGALAGVLFGSAITAWVGISAVTIETNIATRETLPVSTAKCNISDEVLPYTSPLPATDVTEIFGEYNSSVSGGEHLSTSKIDERPLLYDTLYSLSPFNYGIFGFLVCVIVGNFVSVLTGICKPADADPRLFVPLVTNKHLPETVIKFFRFGVPEVIGGEGSIYLVKRERKKKTVLGPVTSDSEKFISATKT